MAMAERIAALEIAAGQVLILCAKGGSAAPVATPGGQVPPAEAAGEMHVAFAIEETEFEGWIERLTAAGIAANDKLSERPQHLFSRSGPAPDRVGHARRLARGLLI